MVSHPDLEEEQRFLERAHLGLEAMRADASRMLEGVLDLGRGGTYQSRTERDIVVRTSLARLAQLDIGDQALCFGRIDRLPEGPDGTGDSYHIGRLAVSGEDLEPLVVDWRAPVAEPFYRATGLDPQGLARRRHLAVKGRTVTGLEDEYFARPGGRGPVPSGSVLDVAEGTGASDGAELEEGLALGGPGALLAALGAARTGQMGDIVATIQREQDEIIRSPLAGVLLVQGGPGTGKTAVALHRAAYLLYTHRFPLERQGVLVVGPNPLFLRYIEQVLPSLGETGVTLSTAAGLVPEVKVRGVDGPEVARLKGDARMSRVLARAVRTRQRALRDDVVIPFGASVLRLRASDSAEIVRLARRRPGPHNGRRRFVEQQVVQRLTEEYLQIRKRLLGSPSVSLPAVELPDDQAPGQLTLLGLAPGDEDATELAGLVDEIDEIELDTAIAETEPDPEDLARQLRRVPELVEALDRMWPRLSPHELLHDLLGARPLLAAAGKGLLSSTELAALYRPRSSALDEVPWTTADAALVDEARTILGPRRSRPGRARSDLRERQGRAREETGFWPSALDPSPTPAGNGSHAGIDDETAVRAYGHIVVDEIQDLSPMQLRMLARRSLSGSMTVVGDIAQATGSWAPKSWDDITAHLSPNRPPRLVELTVSYRTPAEVVELATRVLAVAAPDVTPPRPVRRSGQRPTVVGVALAELADAVARAATNEMAAVAPGRTAVLAPGGLVPELRRSLVAAGLPVSDPREPGGEGLSAALVLLPAHEANGLEFDAVVVVEPALIAAGPGATIDGPGVPPATTGGLRALYVAMTRPTQRLSVVHALALPVDLGDASVAPVAR